MTDLFLCCCKKTQLPACGSSHSVGVDLLTLLYYRSTSSFPFNPERTYFQKIYFYRRFSNFLFKPEVDLKHPKCQIITTIKPDNMPFELLKSVNNFSSYEQKSFFSSKPEVDFQRNFYTVITMIKPKHMPFEFRKSVH